MLIVLGFIFRVNKYIFKVGCIEDIKVFIKCFINKSLKYTRYIIVFTRNIVKLIVININLQTTSRFLNYKDRGSV